MGIIYLIGCHLFQLIPNDLLVYRGAFKSLGDYPHTCIVKPREFDTDLPVVTVENVERTRRAIEEVFGVDELMQEMRHPSEDDVTTSFLFPLGHGDHYQPVELQAQLIALHSECFHLQATNAELRLRAEAAELARVGVRDDSSPSDEKESKEQEIIALRESLRLKSKECELLKMEMTRYIGITSNDNVEISDSKDTEPPLGAGLTDSTPKITFAREFQKFDFALFTVWKKHERQFAAFVWKPQTWNILSTSSLNKVRQKIGRKQQFVAQIINITRKHASEGSNPYNLQIGSVFNELDVELWLPLE
eukprot:m.231244 g.231244  ORF g.231244 m.231244 type:complete len:305 (-) comp16004_c0_seq48:225-1139(-)